MYLKTVFVNPNPSSFVALPKGRKIYEEDEEKPRIQCIQRNKTLERNLKVSDTEFCLG